MTETIIIEKDDAEIAYEDFIVQDKENAVSLKKTNGSMINYPKSDGSFVTYRESLTAYAPKPEEFNALRKKIFRILGRKTTRRFDDKLDYLITFLRQKSYFHAIARSVPERRKDLSRYAKITQKLVGFMDDDDFDFIQEDLHYEISQKMRKNDIEDPVYTLYQRAQDVIEMCNSVVYLKNSGKRWFPVRRLETKKSVYRCKNNDLETS